MRVFEGGTTQKRLHGASHKGTYYMVCSQHHGPLLVVGYITAPNSEVYQNRTLILETTHMIFMGASASSTGSLTHERLPACLGPSLTGS